MNCTRARSFAPRSCWHDPDVRVFLTPKGLHATAAVGAAIAATIEPAANPTWPKRSDFPPSSPRRPAPVPPPRCKACEEEPAAAANGYGLCALCADFYDPDGGESVADYCDRARRALTGSTQR